MASAHYAKAINDIQEYYGVSKSCALYLYHRAHRSLRKDASYMPWNIKLQNALIMADKCIGINWDKISFGHEENNLHTHGINIDEMSDVPFRWIDENSNNEWKIVSNKKKQKKNNKLCLSFTYVGLIVK